MVISVATARHRFPEPYNHLVIEDDFLETYEYDLNHDDPLLYRLMDYAEFYWHEGYEGLEACAEMFFEIYRDAKAGEDAHLRDLRKAYNSLMDSKRIADFEDELTEETLTLLSEKEEALAKELLEFHGDREVWVILEVKDTMYEQSAWFLIAKEALEDLGIKIRRGEA